MPVVLEAAGHLGRGGGVHPLHPPPRSAPALETDIPEGFILLFFFHKKGYIEGGNALTRSQNDETSNICYRHYHIFTKTRSTITTAIAFSRKNDAGSRGRTT